MDYLAELKRLQRIEAVAKEVLRLEYPIPGSERQHPAKAMNGSGKWARLRAALDAKVDE